MNKEAHPLPRTAIAQGAIISVISGGLSLICAFLALAIAIAVMKAGILTYIQAGREYLYPLFWLLWLLPPIATISYSSYIKRLSKNLAAAQRQHTLAQIGFVTGCLSLALTATVALAEIVLFFQTSGCMGPGACS
ncbi:MAG TPA: hypothetical protein VFA41_04350 [Ktedonobacteraceae bacterium]|jgi:hypothetical protein|nr:hypothetical protein [Ktedonobacteraceae bacterium]